MNCHDYREQLMGYLDGELTDEQKRDLERHLQECAACREELEGFRRIIAITSDVPLIEPEDRLWDQYWSGLYNRLERGLGWILFSVAAISFLIYGGFKLIEEVIRDPGLSTLAKVGLLALLAGLVILFISVLRERLFFWRHDRYRHVRR